MTEYKNLNDIRREFFSKIPVCDACGEMIFGGSTVCFVCGKNLCLSCYLTHRQTPFNPCGVK